MLTGLGNYFLSQRFLVVDDSLVSSIITRCIPSAKTLPLIILTYISNCDDGRYFADLGFAVYLPKPALPRDARSWYFRESITSGKTVNKNSLSSSLKMMSLTNRYILIGQKIGFLTLSSKHKAIYSVE
ncbi:MAG: hypothetical protein ACI9CE_002896 [Flavobacterium sp.]|jgi:hypothetical protein